MSVRIRLSKAGEPAETRELLFNQDLISIGRESTNTIPLVDPLVSKAHAKIERKERAYCIVDLRSTNSTYVNSEKLVPGREYAIHEGDEARIAEYVLQFVQVELPGVRESKRPPFESAVPQAPASAEPEVRDQYRKRSGDSEFVQRWSKLKDEIARHLEAFDVEELSARQQELQQQYDTLLQENRALKDQVAEGRKKEQAADARPMEPALAPDHARLANAVSTLMNPLFKLSSAQASFKSEFMGVTVIQGPERLPGELHSGEGALRYYADPQLTEEECTTRLLNLKGATERILLHVMGLLEGYRRSVDEGTHKLLQHVDPELLRQEYANSKVKLGPIQIPYRVLPFFLDLKVFQVLRRRLRDLQHEDRGVLEKRFFRPGFIHGYDDYSASASRSQDVPRAGNHRRREVDKER